MVPIVRVGDWTARGPALAEAFILASRIRLTFTGPNGSGVADGCRKSFSVLESCCGDLLRRNVFEASCGVYRLEMYRSGEVVGVRYPAVVPMLRPLGVRGALPLVAKVGLKVNNGTGVRGKGEGSTSSQMRLSDDGVLGTSYSEAGGEGYESPPLPKP